MRNSIPTQSKVKGQTVSGAPVVLEISIRRNGVPVSRALVSILRVLHRVPKNEVGEIEPAVRSRRAATRGGSSCRSIEFKATLSVGKIVLHLLVNGPAATDLELMRSSRPGKIIFDLIIIGGVVPWHPVHRVISPGCLCQVNVRNSVVNVGPRENPVESEAGRGLENALRQNVNPVPVIVERNFVQQIWPDNVRRMNYVAHGRVVEGVTNRRGVVSAPHGRSERLDCLVGNEVSENGEFVVERVVHPNDFFLSSSWLISAALEGPAASWLRKNPRTEHSGSVRVHQ